jgi:hypothetical protein
VIGLKLKPQKRHSRDTYLQKQFPNEYKYWEEWGWLNKRTYLKERVKGGMHTMFSNRLAISWRLWQIYLVIGK